MSNNNNNNNNSSQNPLPDNSSLYYSVLSRFRPNNFPLTLLLSITVTSIIFSFLLLPSVGIWISFLVIGLLKLILSIILCLLLLLWWCQHLLLYMPTFNSRVGLLRSNYYNTKGFKSPIEYNLKYENIYIKCLDGVIIHAWFIPYDNNNNNNSLSPTIIFLHGNAGNIGFRLPNTKSLFHSCSANILMVEYRGFGESSGSPSEMGLQLDAQASLEWLLNSEQIHRIDPNKIFIFGRSLGGAAAIWLTHKYQSNIAGLILENTFTNIEDMVLSLSSKMNINLDYKLFRIFLYVFMTSHWNSLQLIGKIACPILFISGQLDELVPKEQMQLLYNTSKNIESNNKIYYPVLLGTHNDTFMRGGAHYWKTLADFVLQYSKTNNILNNNQNNNNNNNYNNNNDIKHNITATAVIS